MQHRAGRMCGSCSRWFVRSAVSRHIAISQTHCQLCMHVSHTSGSNQASAAAALTACALGLTSGAWQQHRAGRTCGSGTVLESPCSPLLAGKPPFCTPQQPSADTLPNLCSITTWHSDPPLLLPCVCCACDVLRAAAAPVGLASLSSRTAVTRRMLCTTWTAAPSWAGNYR